MIVMTNKLALLYFWYVWFQYLWQFPPPFFYKDVLSQALSEDAAWDFLIIFKNDFYSIFTILIFYNNFSFHRGGVRLIN